jgi:NodT family efflux transporter outer membrane factor (OMF) lipoprotein
VDETAVPELDTITSSDWQQHGELISWADVLEQPTLQSLINEALANNYDLQAAAARWQAAREQVTVAGGPRWPSLGANLDGQRQDIDKRTIDSYRANLDVSWELDIWGKLALRQQSSFQAALQQQEFYRWSELSLAAQLTRTWLDSIEASQQLELAREREASLIQSLAVIESGFQSGIRSAFDVYSARAELAAAETATIVRQQSYRANLRRVATLLGRYPDTELDVPGDLPELKSTVPETLSVELLERRPDLKSAAHSLLAQQSNAGVASRNRLPSISISGRYGAANDSFSDVLSGDDVVWSALGGITAPIFQGGALAAEERRQQALLEASIADYKQTAITALGEVEQAMDNEQLISRQLLSGQNSVKVSKHAENQAFEQYVSGISSFNTWLQAQRTSFDRSSQLLELQNNLLKNRIDMYLALGGDFGTQAKDLSYAK